MSKLIHLRESYHKLISKEYEKYKNNSFSDSLTMEDIKQLKITDEVLHILIDKGFLLKISDNKFRTLLFDAAYRISDIRIKHHGTKYVLESSLQLKRRPILYNNYIIFNRNDKNLEILKNSIDLIIGSNLTNRFIDGLMEAGISGLSHYQFWAIKKILDSNKDIVLDAPTAFGKTYAFILPILIESIKSYINRSNGTIAIILYPRKSLGSDQMGRLVRIIYYINKNCDTNITIGIDDGDVKRDYRNGEQFRGIKCPVHVNETLIIKDRKVYCEKCDKYFDFICLSRSDFETHPPTIIVSNVWTYQYRITNKKYWKNGYISENIKFLVLDEVHAYRSLVAGIVRYIIKIHKQLVNPKTRFIFSSATIPKLKEFVEEISGNKFEDMVTLSYDENYHGKDSEKLELYLMIGINPYTSWETYTHELAIYLSTVNRLKKYKNLQSLIFVDSIKNINRLYSQTREAIKLGDPIDHLDSTLKPDDPFCYWIYNEEYKVDPKDILKKKEYNSLGEEIINNIEYHYSYRSDRFELEEKIKNGKIDVVYSTSTLELGVDYDNVSVVVNCGIPFTLESIVQRIGRAGRNEERTLNTSLSVIIVRNNPLEYFYLYKGIENLLDTQEMAKIPVSYTNQFVIFYAIFLYIYTLFVKEGRNVGKGLKMLESIINYYNDNQQEILKTLAIDIRNVNTAIKNEIEDIINILRDEDIEEKYKNVKYYIDSKQLEKRLSEIIDDITRYIETMENVYTELPKRDIRQFEDRFNELKKIFSTISDNNEYKLDIIKKLIDSNSLHNLQDAIWKLCETITSINNPLYKFRKEGIMIMNNIQECIDIVNEMPEFNVGLESKYNHNIYIKAYDIYKNFSENIIKLLESILGFKFMGSEFIDQTVNLKSEYESDKTQEDSLTSIITRIPPLELVNIPFEEKDQRKMSNYVGARHFWLVKPKNYLFIKNNSIKDELKRHWIAKGQSEKLENIAIPQKIELLDLMTLEEPIIIRMQTNKGPLYIKYGSANINNYKIYGKFPIKDNIKRLYTNNEKKEYIENVTLNTLKEIDDKLKSKNKWGLNFRYVSMCKLGQCISTDPYDFKCPNEVVQDCGLCDGKKFWNVYKKIFPKFFTHLTVRNLIKEDEPLINTIKTKTYEQLNDEIEFIYDAMYSYLPVKLGEYLLREIKINPLGYRAKTSYICIRFNSYLVDVILNILLKNNGELLELLKYKYFMYSTYKSRGSNIDTALMYNKYKKNFIDITDAEFKRFIKNSLIHSLAHMFYVYLAVERVRIDTERMVYYIDDSNIYILENSKNDGLGIVETIKNQLLKKTFNEFMMEFYKWCRTFLIKHEKRINEIETTITKESQESIKLLKIDNKKRAQIEKILLRLKQINEDIAKYVPLKFIDIVTYRLILSQNLEEQASDEEAEYLLTLVSSQEYPNLCFDGCNECLIFSTGCIEPFTQFYLLSRQLLVKFIDILEEGTITLIDKNLGEFIEELMNISDKITIKSPFIDDFGISLLEKLAKSGKNINLITRRTNTSTVKTLEENNIKVTLSEHNFHSKIFYFEKNNEQICISGSMNLTKNSFYENEENITIYLKKDKMVELKF